MTAFLPVTGTQLDQLLMVGGTAANEDLAAARAAAARLPQAVAAFLLRKRARIVVCRESVTDHERSLRGARPRGWPEGKTWDIVPGAYLPKRSQVVVATRAGPSGRRIAPQGDGHGSVDLLLHETMHGHDFLKKHRLIRDRTFTNARLADMAMLGEYERQQGDAGLQETYAESAARAFAAEAAPGQAWPNLSRFWALLDESELEAGLEAAEEPPVELDLGADTPIGTATVEMDGALLLDLRADGPDGEIGHGLVRLDRGEPGYEAVAEQMGGMEALEGMATESSLPRRPILLRPIR